MTKKMGYLGGKNIRHSAPAQGAGLSWLAASRMCELRDRAIPFRETCCPDGLTEQSSFGMQWKREDGTEGYCSPQSHNIPHHNASPLQGSSCEC